MYEIKQKPDLFCCVYSMLQVILNGVEFYGHGQQFLKALRRLVDTLVASLPTGCAVNSRYDVCSQQLHSALTALSSIAYHAHVLVLLMHALAERLHSGYCAKQAEPQAAVTAISVYSSCFLQMKSIC
jgi:hypothetical protein